MNNPQVVKFSNEQARRAADRFGGLYFTAKELCDAWDAQGLDPLVPDTAEAIEDGSAQDGRPPMTCGRLRVLVAYCRAFVSRAEFTSLAQPEPDKAKFQSVCVNPR